MKISIRISRISKILFHAALQFALVSVTANQLKAQCTPPSITNVTSVGTAVFSTYTISMANTTSNVLSGSADLGGLATVYTVSSYTPVAGNNTHIFSTPFTWNDTLNVLINICQTYGSGSTASTVA